MIDFEAWITKFVHLRNQYDELLYALSLIIYL